MDTSNILGYILGGGFGITLFIMTLIQIAPIKVNPWSFIFKRIGRAMNEEVITKVDGLGDELKDLRNACDEREANSCRTRILHFNDEILHKINHTKEHFDQILIDISTYEKYCNSHPNYKNNIANIAIEHIEHTYSKCCDEGTFL